jgi:hypothetical protein
MYKCQWKTPLNKPIFGKRKFLTRKSSGNSSKKKIGGKNLTPRNMKARHSINTTALLHNVAKIETQSTLKSSRKTLHEFSPHNP